MAWLFGQLWLLLLVAFILGAIVAWIIARIALPHVDEIGYDDSTEVLR